MNGAGIVHKLTQKTTGAHTYTIAVQLSAVRGVLRVILKSLIIELLNNKFHGLSPSGGFASLSFDQGVP